MTEESGTEGTMAAADGLPDIGGFDWGSERLTRKEKLFCFFLAHPDTRGNASLAARKAGYDANSVKHIGYRLLRKGKIRSAIRRLERAFYAESIGDAYGKVIKRLVNRATVDRASLYSFETVVNDAGQERLKVTPKAPGELTDAQRDLIEGVEYSSACGLPNYRLYPSEKAEREIMRLHERMQGAERDAGYDSEAVVEVIKGGLQVKASIIQKNSEMAALANLRDSPSELRAEED